MTEIFMIYTTRGQLRCLDSNLFVNLKHFIYEYLKDHILSIFFFIFHPELQCSSGVQLFI